MITVKAPTLAEGKNLLNTVLPRAVSMTHTTAIVIGEKLAKAGMQEIIGSLFRFREYRGSIFWLWHAAKALRR